MRLSPVVILVAGAFPLLTPPDPAAAQDRGMALNMGRGLDNGMSVGWTFKENWTLRPTLGAGYSQQTGFQAAIGSTVLRSFSLGERFHAYGGAGIYYGSANTGVSSQTVSGPGALSGGNGRANQGSGAFAQSTGSIAYITAPIGLRARVHGNFEAFAEAAYQRTVSGQFGLSHTGQFSGNASERYGATFGISMRFQ